MNVKTQPLLVAKTWPVFIISSSACFINSLDVGSGPGVPFESLHPRSSYWQLAGISVAATWVVPLLPLAETPIPWRAKTR